jgi:hypothetical protein
VGDGETEEGKRRMSQTPDLVPSDSHDFIRCVLCERPFKQISGGSKGHLAQRHGGITTEQYLELPGAQLTADGTKEHISEIAKRRVLISNLGRPRRGRTSYGHAGKSKHGPYGHRQGKVRIELDDLVVILNTLLQVKLIPPANQLHQC